MASLVPLSITPGSRSSALPTTKCPPFTTMPSQWLLSSPHCPPPMSTWRQRAEGWADGQGTSHSCCRPCRRPHLQRRGVEHSIVPSDLHGGEEICPWLRYVYNLQFDQEEGVYKRYLCGEWVTRKLRAGHVVLGVDLW
jgi:hypothetical protein